MLTRISSAHSWSFLSRTCLLSLLCTAFAIPVVCSERAPPADESPLPRSRVRPLLEIKASYFTFTKEKMRHIYDDGALELQVSGSYPLWEWLEIYGSVGFLEASGRSLKGHQKTTLQEIPLDVGLKPVFKVNDHMQYYFAVGPHFYYVHQHHHSSYIPHNNGRYGVGLFANTGFNFMLSHNLFLDVFAEYTYARTHFHTTRNNVYSNDIQIGGVSFGLGLGHAF